MATNSQFRAIITVEGRESRTIYRKRLDSLISRVAPDALAVIEQMQPGNKTWRACGAVHRGQYHEGEYYGLAAGYLPYWESIGNQLGGWQQLHESKSLYVPHQPDGPWHRLIRRWQSLALIHSVRKTRFGVFYNATSGGIYLSYLMLRFRSP